MATKSFLATSEIKECDRLLVPPTRCPDGNEKVEILFPNQNVSHWIGERLEEKLGEDPDWLAASPVALGSWGRGELCPRSDIDVLFCGEEKSILRVIERVQEKGLRLRHRTPEDLTDWTVGVGPKDWLAFINGKGFTPQAFELLQSQKQLMRSKGKKVARKIAQTLLSERIERNKRYDSISNYLEPNLKYGAGGLRDLQQALYLVELFPEKFPSEDHALEVLYYYRKFLLSIRQKLHVFGGGDVLVAQFQQDIGDWLGYPNTMAFMRELQKGLSRVSFYSDWVFETVRASKKTMDSIQKKSLRTAHDCFAALRENPSVLMQNRVRRQQDLVFQGNKVNPKQIGKWLSRYIHPDVEDEFVLALFRSRFIDKCLPSLRRLIGLVQHNQYHRYTADTHILQCVRVLIRLRRKQKQQKRLKPIIDKLKPFDWQVLVWTCIYHDIGKGRKGDHSVLGAKIAKTDLEQMGLPKRVVEEVVWMVKNHLLLSIAAFRKNPQSRETWKHLYEEGVQGQRLYRLMLFTCIDIQATNPDAWNEWKESLLLDLVAALEHEEASSLIKFLEFAKSKKVKLNPEFLVNLDSLVLQHVPHRVLLDDYLQLRSKKKKLPPRIVGSGQEKWVRFYEKVDSPGLFVGFVRRLFSSGASIRQASVRTSDKWGVYDWFHIKTSKSNVQLKRLLNLNHEMGLGPQIKFDTIDIVNSNKDELILSFRGRDRKGALVSAAHALFELDLEIRWAAVHTWGRMLDDVFGVKAPENPGAVLEKLREALT